jgi:pimeloyl-ACP methyl ester carboxylesterase
MSNTTVVLVHGAFADASGWTEVVTNLQRDGHTVYAPANPLRGLSSDAAYVRSFLETLDGPVVLAAHSYGGAVITNAATGLEHVKALVYIAGFALDDGETVDQATRLAGEPPDLVGNAVIRPFPGAAEGDGDAYLNPDVFPQVFCQDLPTEVGAAMGATQRPAALASLVQPSGPPAWRGIPSWYLVASSDRVIPPGAERVMAQRAGSTTVEIESSHVAMISHADEVTSLIRDAVAATGG